MWQPGETVNFSAADHVEAILRHSRKDLLDCVIVNTRPIGVALKRKYARQSAQPVLNDIDRLKEMGLTVIEADLLDQKQKVRHDPEALAGIVMDLAAQGQRRRQQRAHQPD
jgi:uncharacterized cofD-like protein